MIFDAQYELDSHIHRYPEDSLTAHCPTCLLRLEICNSLMECECCDSLLQLARREPPAFDLVKLGTILETPAEKEERIRYEEEMSKISLPKQKNRHTEVVEIDISEASRALRAIRRMDYLPILCGFMFVSSVGLILSGRLEVEEVAILLFLAMILIPGIFAGYMHIGVIDERAWRYFLFILPLLLLIVLFSIMGAFILIAEGNLIGEIPALFYNYLYLSFASASFISALRLRTLRLSLIKLSLIKLLSELRNHGGNIPMRSKSVRRLNKPLGIFLAALGIITILVNAFMPSLLNSPRGIAFYVSMTIGWGILLRSRRYFQIDADSLLSVDKRRPILFLRQFCDDPKLNFRGTGLRLIENYLDFSLEIRLSNHFKRFGPFIAVGVSGETVPVPGAARAILSHREWISTVSDWMNEAKVIVMYAGWTNWVSWELAKIIETNNINKLILIIPEVVGEACAIRAEHISLRIERLNRVLKDTIWCNSLTKIPGIEDVRAILFRDDGSVVVIRSQPYNRDSYHLATLIAHYILINQNNRASPLERRGGFIIDENKTKEDGEPESFLDSGVYSIS